MKPLIILLLLCLTARADLNSDVAAWTNANPGGVYVAYIGDSITAGYSAYRPATDGGPSGDTNANVASQLLTYSGGVVTATNRGVQGRVWGQMTYDVTNALKNRPKYVFVRCGINDVNVTNDWSNIESNMNVVRGTCLQSNALMVVQDILPRTTGGDFQAFLIRTWNSNFNNYASTTGIKRVQDHDLFGTNRVSTGFPDNIITDFNLDGIHYKPAAYPLWARITYTNLLQWATPAPWSAAANAVTVHSINMQ